MAKGFKHGAGGGNPLNFSIVGGRSQPANPRENMIWVNTDQKITGWVFSAEQPTEPVEGMVWFSTGTSSPAAFNALKKNNIHICPMIAKQYADGEWADKTAETFMGSDWVEWTHYLYNQGSEMVPFSKRTDTQGLVENKADHVLLSKSGNARPYLGWWTEDSVDLSGYKKLCAEVVCTVELIASDFAAWKFKFGVFSAKLTGFYGNSSSNMIAGTGFTGNAVKTVYEVDITDVAGGYVGVQGTGVAEVYKIWLE